MEYTSRLLPQPSYGLFASDDLKPDWMVIRRADIERKEA